MPYFSVSSVNGSSGLSKRLPTGVFPLRRADHALAVIAEAFPGAIEPCGDALSGALMNAGPIIHPPLILMNAGPIEHFERWDIHKEGTQPAIRRVTDRLDGEHASCPLGRRARRMTILGGSNGNYRHSRQASTQ